MLYKVVLSFESVDKILKYMYKHINSASNGTFYNATCMYLLVYCTKTIIEARAKCGRFCEVFL